MKSNQFLVIDKSALPEIYEKVLYATSLLESGEASSTSEAVRLAGISRSVYYKYKDSVFAYQKRDSGGIVTVQVILHDRPGVLMNLLTVFYEANANILTVTQNIPVKGRAFVSISARGENMKIDADQLLMRVREVDGVIKIDSIVG
jgi:chorismate mutase